jgi:hypothetical protein
VLEEVVKVMVDVAVGNLAGISEPATKFIEKVSDAIGVLYEPHHTLRMAKAEAKAALVKAQADIGIYDLQQRAAQRVIHEEVKKQINMESITSQALPLLEDTATPENVNDDWMLNFFDKCKLISDEDMQHLWAKILAGEANSPGKYSKKTLNIISDIDQRDAKIFQRLLGFCWAMPVNFIPTVIDLNHEICKSNGINLGALNHLETLGLVNFSLGSDFGQLYEKTSSKVISYFGRKARISSSRDNLTIHVGCVLLTDAGEQLAQVCEGSSIEGLYEYICSAWASQGAMVMREIY